MGLSMGMAIESLGVRQTVIYWNGAMDRGNDVRDPRLACYKQRTGKP